MKRLGILCVLFCLLPLTLSAQTWLIVVDYHYTDGNRFIDGTGTFPDVEMLTIEGIIAEGTHLQPHITERGTQVIRVVSPDGTVQPVVVSGTIPNVDYVSALPPDASPRSLPVQVAESTYVYVATNGDLVLWRNDDENGELDRVQINALPDARPMVSDVGDIAIYTQPTERYPHGVMGDDLEALAVTIVDITDTETLDIRSSISLQNDPNDAVFEGLYPLWADVDDDGVQEIVITQASRVDGAAISAFGVRDDDPNFADSDPIGLGNRWRHVLAFGAFGPNGESELVEVQTPHIGGIVQFLRYDPDSESLRIVAQLSGYTSHVFGAPELDEALAGDFNGDGQPEIVLTTQNRTRLVGLQHVENGIIREMWSLPLAASPMTNFVALSLPDGGLVLAIGLSDGSLRLWHPAGLYD